jgi:hypothetical protein
MAERRSVFVARSRHKNAVERNRCSAPFGIVIQPVALDEKISEVLGGKWLTGGGMIARGSGVDQSAP